MAAVRHQRAANPAIFKGGTGILKAATCSRGGISVTTSIEWVLDSNGSQWTITTSSNMVESYTHDSERSKTQKNIYGVIPCIQHSEIGKTNYIVMEEQSIKNIKEMINTRVRLQRQTCPWSEQRITEATDLREDLFSPLQELHRCPVQNYLLSFILMVCAFLICMFIFYIKGIFKGRKVRKNRERHRDDVGM